MKRIAINYQLIFILLCVAVFIYFLYQYPLSSKYVISSEKAKSLIQDKK